MTKETPQAATSPTATGRLADLRHLIDRVDEELIAALGRRFALVREVAEVKGAASLPVRDHEREAEIYRRANQHQDGAAIGQCFETVLRLSRSRQRAHLRETSEQKGVGDAGV